MVIGGTRVSTPEDYQRITDNNLIVRSAHWTPGTSGTQGPFTKNGTDDENAVEYQTGPLGAVEAILTTANGNDNGDGGWNTDVNIDPDKTYRNTVWMKQTGGNSQRLYLGCSQSNTKNLMAPVTATHTTGAATYRSWINGTRLSWNHSPAKHR